MATLVRHQPDGLGARLFFEVPAASRAAHTAIGQYCVIQVGEDQGYFALASSPGAALFEFYLTPSGEAARALLASPVSAEVSVGAPAGSGFGVEAMLGGGDPLVVLATGSALGAVMGAIRAAKAAGHAVVVYYGSRTLEGAPYQAQLAELGIDLRLVLSGGGGYVQDALAADAPDLSGAWLVACGQSAMQARAKEIGAQLGLPEARFLTNY